jgi:hypothetical protein
MVVLMRKNAENPVTLDFLRLPRLPTRQKCASKRSKTRESDATWVNVSSADLAVALPSTIMPRLMTGYSLLLAAVAPSTGHGIVYA